MKKMIIGSDRRLARMNREQMEQVEGGSLLGFVIAGFLTLILADSCQQTTTVNVYGGNETRNKQSSDSTSVDISADVPICSAGA